MHATYVANDKKIKKKRKNKKFFIKRLALNYII